MRVIVVRKVEPSEGHFGRGRYTGLSAAEQTTTPVHTGGPDLLKNNNEGRAYVRRKR
jgi:hypothetical protein